MKYIIGLFMIVFLWSCSQPAKQAPYKPIVDVYNTPKGDKIIFLDDYYRSYLKAIKAGNKNYDSLYKADISGPIQSGYFSKCEYSQYVGSEFRYPIVDTTGLKYYTFAIKKNEGRIDSIITDALVVANKLLKNDSITILIQPSNYYNRAMMRKMGGVYAFTAGSKQILIAIDTTVHSWQEVLKYCVAHEFNHTYWTKMKYNKSTPFTLLDWMILEGRADTYADMLYPDNKSPWTMALTEQEKIDLWKRLQPNLQSEDQTLQHDVMFGSDTYPQWGGYTLGFNIVQSALRNHPELKPLEWATMDPKKILEMSNYK